ncbi:MAG: DNA polymerase III subunit alpha, partial [Chloroflexi bacterium]|nr:DNA polymerase III subunit alpha [Chloroflexota bacterium]
SHLTLLAESQDGYRNLCRLISAGRMNAPKGESSLAWAKLAEHAHGLICLTGCRRGPVARPMLTGDVSAARRALARLIDLFGRADVYVELQRNLRRDDAKLSRRLAELARESRLACVATGDVHYLTRDDADLQSVLVSLRERLPLAKAGNVVRPNHEYFLRSPAAMSAFYPDLPAAIANTLEVAERCNAALPSGLQTLPQYPTPNGRGALAHLRRLCETQLIERYPERARHKATRQLAHELTLIAQLGLANYFLVVWDIVNFCRRESILCHGRGSAANSIVAYLLGISAVDPIAQELVVERFLSVEHGGTPDIDLDIDAARRERVIQYAYERWGREHAAMACTYVTYRSASAIRDAGFALGFNPAAIEAVATALDTARHKLDEDGRVELPEAPIPEATKNLKSPDHRLSSAEWQRLVTLVERLRRRPRHLGLHNGGMILTGEPIGSLIPVEPATMENRTVVQFDKEWLEQMGIVKVDLLGLRMLSAIADTVEMTEGGRMKAEGGSERSERGASSTTINVPQSAIAGLSSAIGSNFRDPAVYDQICSGQTIGLFQVESGAQVSIIPDMQPRCFQDLVVEVSLIRPGPLQGNMVRPYLRRRKGLEPVTYPHPSLKPALANTLGVIVFQEQVIKIARDFAGFTPGRGEVLRRALGSKHSQEALQHFRAEFIAGATAQGASRAVAEQVWQMLAGFAGYSFSQAHAAAFAVIVYWSAWLRVYYPSEYFCGLLRNSPLGTYPPNVIESEARRAGVKFLSFDVNRSPAKARVESGRIRFGLDYVKGIGAERAEFIVEQRADRPFRSLADFIERTGLERRAVESLVLAGAFDSLGERRQLLWDLAEAFEIARRPKSHPPLPFFDVPDERATMPPMDVEQKVALTFASTGVTAGPHLVELRRDAFTRAGCVPYRQLLKLRTGAKVKVGGLVADGLRRPPTAKGTSFIRLEEQDGLIDVIIPLAVYAECREALRAAFVVVEGTLQRRGAVVTIVAQSVRLLSG